LLSVIELLFLSLTVEHFTSNLTFKAIKRWIVWISVNVKFMVETCINHSKVCRP